MCRLADAHVEYRRLDRVLNLSANHSPLLQRGRHTCELSLFHELQQFAKPGCVRDGVVDRIFFEENHPIGSLFYSFCSHSKWRFEFPQNQMNASTHRRCRVTASFIVLFWFRIIRAFNSLYQTVGVCAAGSNASDFAATSGSNSSESAWPTWRATSACALNMARRSQL